MPVIGNIGSTGRITTAHDAINESATSAPITCVGYNAILVEAIVTKAWTIEILGSLSETGHYSSVSHMKYQTNEPMITMFKGTPGYIKIVATSNEPNGTCSIKVQPINV